MTPAEAAVATLPPADESGQHGQAREVLEGVRAAVAATPQSPAAAALQAGVPSRVAVDEVFRPLGEELDRLGDEVAEALCLPH